jgi:chromosomal replication initiator protein
MTTTESRIRLANSALQVLRLVEAETSTPVLEIIGKRRTRRAAAARDIAAVAMRIMLPMMTYAEIADALGGRDHSTIVHSIKRTRTKLSMDKKLAATLGRIVFLKTPCE